MTFSLKQNKNEMMPYKMGREYYIIGDEKNHHQIYKSFV